MKGCVGIIIIAAAVVIGISGGTLFDIESPLMRGIFLIGCLAVAAILLGSMFGEDNA